MDIKKAFVLLTIIGGLAGAVAPAQADEKSASADECRKAINIINDLIRSGCNDKALYELRADALEQLNKSKVSHHK